MSRRKLFFAVSSLTAAVTCAVVSYLTPRVTVENYQKVHDGMVLSDVEALLGTPTGDRIQAINYLFLCSDSGALRQEYAAVKAPDIGLQWHDRGGTILVGFRPGGTVIFKRYDPRQHEAPLHMLCRLLRL